MKKLNKHGFGHSALILGIIVIVAIVGVGYRVATKADPLKHIVTLPQAALLHSKHVCDIPKFNQVMCLSDILVGPDNKQPTFPAPVSYTPAELQSAYNLTNLSGSGRTVAIVDAFDDPNVESDLAVYRSKFGLSPCTTANGCFKKVNQNGGSTMPVGNTSWGTEISLDVDMVSAICPSCHILLVEANSNYFADITTAVKEASALGAYTTSNSYGGLEFAGEINWESAYNHQGEVAGSGDNHYPQDLYPAASQYVTAVGGTTLRKTNSTSGHGSGSTTTTSWTETTWSGAGSGCSPFIAKPSWQKDTGCSGRTVADVAAVADPYTGVSVYDTYYTNSTGGWFKAGGTSAATPIIASIYTLAGNIDQTVAGSYPYSHTSFLHDIVGGSNGSCSGTYICTGVVGYDGPTGVGSPNGIGAF